MVVHGGCEVSPRRTRPESLKTKYSYDEANCESFRGEYGEMPAYGKAMENKPLVGGGVVTTLLVLFGVLLSVGEV